MAGFLPGLLMAVAMGISVYITSKRKGYPTEPKMPWKLRMKMFVRAIPSLMTIVIIIGGIWGGFFTPTEAAVVASAYALILGVFVYKELKPKDVLKVLKESMLQSCKTLFIIAVANFLAYFLTHQRIPNMVIEALASVTTNPQLQILIIIGVLLILGMFIEGTARDSDCDAGLYADCLPNRYGPDSVRRYHDSGQHDRPLTPPVGMSLYAVSSVCEVKVLDLAKAVIPYLIGIFIVLLIAAYWAPLSMFLPNLFA